MTKNKEVYNHDTTEEDFDFSEMMCDHDHDHDHDDNGMGDIMHGILEASNNQMLLAIELTKLAVEKSTPKSLNEDDIFAIFKKASAVIAEASPLNGLLEKLQ
jgi:ABC-type Zn2+ transport system substrate-binding protein/surface adhesin